MDLLLLLFFVHFSLSKSNGLTYNSTENLGFEKKVTVFGNIQENNNLLLVVDTKELIEQGKLGTRCWDLKFLDEDRKVLRYWMENGCNTANTNIWIDLSTFNATNTTSNYIYMKYGIEEDVMIGKIDYYGSFFLPFHNPDDDRNCGNGWNKAEDMYSRFAKGKEHYGHRGGSEEHSHFMFGQTGMQQSSNKYEDAVAGTNECASNAHRHSFFIETRSTKNSIPYFSVLFCQNQNLNIGKHFIGIFESEDDFNSVDQEIFTKFNSLNNRFPKGYHTSGYYSDSNSHSHYYFEQTESGSGITNINYASDVYAPNVHSHSIQGNTATVSNTLPPYKNVLFAQVSKDVNIAIPKNMIVLTSVIPPIGYKRLEEFDDKFLRGSITQIGGTGGTTSHQHSFSGNSYSNTNSKSLDANVINIGPDCLTDTHYHTYSGVTLNLPDLNIPPYVSYLVAKKIDPKLIFSISAEYVPSIVKPNSTNPNNIVVVENPDLYYLFLLIPAIVLSMCVIFAVVGLFLLCFIFNQKKKIKKFEDLEDIDILLMEQQANRESKKVNFKVNKKLFEINYADLKLIREIGNGGSQSVIYLADWKRKKVAFKVFTNVDVTGDVDFSNFEREVTLMSSISHPNILSFYGASLNPQRIGIVMEYASNGDLVSYCNMLQFDSTKKLTFLRKLKILNETSAALEYLHERDIIHRDVKAENILLAKDLTTKLIDFGLSRSFNSSSKNEMTVYIGTSCYMAPEVVKGGKYSSKCDCFSFGILMYCLLTTNFTPYKNKDGLSPQNIELKVSKNPNFRPKIDEKKFEKAGITWFTELMKKCWDDNPTKRPSMQEIVKEITEKMYNKDLVYSKNKHEEVIPVVPKTKSYKKK